MTRSGNVTLAYGLAAWLVMIGVGAVWVYLKQSSASTTANLPSLPNISAFRVDSESTGTLLERAQAAYAAGRVTQPQEDSALFFFQRMLALDSGDAAALNGLRLIADHLVSDAEGALARNDFEAAQTLAQEALTLNPDLRRARQVLSGVTAHDQVGKLLRSARAQLDAGRLTKPAGDNARASYRAVLRINPAHTEALQGMEIIAERLATQAQAEVLADRVHVAEALLAEARKISADAPGIQVAEQLSREWAGRIKDEAVRAELRDASSAANAGRLLSGDVPGQLGALDFYRSALQKDPQSEAARIGLEFVVERTLERTWTQIREEDFAAAEDAIARLEAGGVEGTRTLELRTELSFLKRRAANRRGEFADQDVLPISELTVKRQITPTMNESVPRGAVELAFTVNEEGRVADIELIAADNPKLGAAVTDAFSRWRFEPYLVDERAIPVRSMIRMIIE